MCAYQHLGYQDVHLFLILLCMLCAGSTHRQSQCQLQWLRLRWYQADHHRICQLDLYLIVDCDHINHFGYDITRKRDTGGTGVSMLKECRESTNYFLCIWTQVLKLVHLADVPWCKKKKKKMWSTTLSRLKQCTPFSFNTSTRTDARILYSLLYLGWYRDLWTDIFMAVSVQQDDTQNEPAHT